MTTISDPAWQLARPTLEEERVWIDNILLFWNLGTQANLMKQAKKLNQ